MTTPAETRFGSFDFGLSPADEVRAAELHASAIIIDILHMGPCGYKAFTDEHVELFRAEWDEHRNWDNIWLLGRTLHARLGVAGESDELRKSWDDSGLTAASCDLALRDPGQALTEFGAAQLQFDHFDWLDKATRASHIRHAKRRGNHAAFINTQDTVWFGKDLSLIQAGWDLGLRMMQLTYNSHNLVGSGCTDIDGGITEFGVRVVRTMNELGMIVDTGHCGRRTTLDACRISDAPVVASHTSAKSVYFHDRGKTDEEFEAIAKTGGVIGIYAMPPCLGSDQDLAVTTMLDHIDHVVEVVGTEHVSVGADWPMSLPKWVLGEISERVALTMGFRPEHNLDEERNLLGFDDYRDFPNITRGLMARGYTETAIRQILGENFLRVFERVCG